MAKYTPCLNEECFFTNRTDRLERHHIFGGSNRKHSEKYGLKVFITHDWHNEPPNGVHHSKEHMQLLHEYGQAVFEETHTREEFMAIFGRNYL